MPEQVIAPRIRGFICLNAHPDGCAAEVRRQIDHIRATCPGQGLQNVLVLGSSTGYGLASLLTSVFGYGADALSICYERPASERKPGSAGFYNLVEAQAQARAAGRQMETINGDAFSSDLKQQAIATLKERFGKLDLIVYSLAAPRRKDPASDTTWTSVLKPIGQGFSGKTIDLTKDVIDEAHFEAATQSEIADTVQVMGGEDWRLWIEALRAADLLAEGCRSVAYSYIGPEVTKPIYRSGTIGAAKEHLEATAQDLNQTLQTLGGGAWVSVNKALVTQASAAIPVVPLYISLLYQVMKEAGSHEGCVEQIARLFTEHLGPGQTPQVDEAGRIRIDDREMDPAIQAEVARRWQLISTERIDELSDYAGFKTDFRRLFGFDVAGLDYDQPTETLRSLT